MSEEETIPLFYVVCKSTGKQVHKYIVGKHHFYRRDIKATGYATFSCSTADCKATMSCRYSSKESGQETEEEPQILR